MGGREGGGGWVLAISDNFQSDCLSVNREMVFLIVHNLEFN